jgi:hypothetical protein
MNPVDFERILKESMARYIKAAVIDIPVVFDEDYSSLTEELDNLNIFAVVTLGDGTISPKIYRVMGVSIYVKEDPGSVLLNQYLGRVAAKASHLSSLPLYDGDAELLPLVVTEPNLRGVAFAVDQFRAKGLEFTLRGALT